MNITGIDGNTFKLEDGYVVDFKHLATYRVRAVERPDLSKLKKSKLRHFKTTAEVRWLSADPARMFWFNRLTSSN